MPPMLLSDGVINIFGCLAVLPTNPERFFCSVRPYVCTSAPSTLTIFPYVHPERFPGISLKRQGRNGLQLCIILIISLSVEVCNLLSKYISIHWLGNWHFITDNKINIIHFNHIVVRGLDIKTLRTIPATMIDIHFYEWIVTFSIISSKYHRWWCQKIWHIIPSAKCVTVAYLFYVYYCPVQKKN